MSYQLVSIIMSVRNGMPYLPETVDSILCQTYTNFEFIILDNASTDGSAEWVEALHDPRVRLVRNECDLGLSGSLNRGLALAHGKYIARMDADDIAMPDRIALQVAFLEKHPDVIVCGGQVETFGAVVSRPYLPCCHEEMLAMLPFSVPLTHPAVMYRQSLLQQNALCYNDDLSVTQDYALWCDIAKKNSLRMANIPECVLQYRIHASNNSTTEARICQERQDIQKDFIRFMGVTDFDTVAHKMLCSEQKMVKVTDFIAVISWIFILFNANDSTKKIEKSMLYKQVLRQWQQACLFAEGMAHASAVVVLAVPYTKVQWRGYKFVILSIYAFLQRCFLKFKSCLR